MQTYGIFYNVRHKRIEGSCKLLVVFFIYFPLFFIFFFIVLHFSFTADDAQKEMQ